MPGVNLADVILPDDLEQALVRKVESGQFTSRGAVIEQALRSFLVKESVSNAPVMGLTPRRRPGAFLLDEEAYGPDDIPRSGIEIECNFVRGEKRRPDRYPGE